MRLEWERPGVVRMSAKIEELAALLAGARLAAAALESQPSESTSGLRNVLTDFDRAVRRLTRADGAERSDGAPILATPVPSGSPASQRQGTPRDTSPS